MRGLGVGARACAGVAARALFRRLGRLETSCRRAGEQPVCEISFVTGEGIVTRGSPSFREKELRPFPACSRCPRVDPPRVPAPAVVPSGTQGSTFQFPKISTASHLTLHTCCGFSLAGSGRLHLAFAEAQRGYRLSLWMKGTAATNELLDWGKSKNSRYPVLSTWAHGTAVLSIPAAVGT